MMWRGDQSCVNKWVSWRSVWNPRMKQRWKDWQQMKFLGQTFVQNCHKADFHVVSFVSFMKTRFLRTSSRKTWDSVVHSDQNHKNHQTHQMWSIITCERWDCECKKKVTEMPAGLQNNQMQQSNCSIFSFFIFFNSMFHTPTFTCTSLWHRCNRCNRCTEHGGFPQCGGFVMVPLGWRPWDAFLNVCISSVSFRFLCRVHVPPNKSPVSPARRELVDQIALVWNLARTHFKPNPWSWQWALAPAS